MKTFYLHGAGSAPDGTTCGYAWVRTDRRAQRVRRCAVMTQHQATYRGLLSILRYLAPGSSAIVRCSSQLLVCQLSGEYRVRNEELLLLLIRVQDIIEEKHLDIEVRWVRREENLAADLLSQHRRG